MGRCTRKQLGNDPNPSTTGATQTRVTRARSLRSILAPFARTHPVKKCVTGSQRSLANLSDFNHHVSAFHSQRVDRNSRAWVVRSLATLGIPLPAVPGTNHLVPVNHALPQRP